MKAGRYSRKLYAGLTRAPAYLHGKQSLARLSDVLILWKQFLRRCAPDKDAAVSGVVSFAHRVRGSTNTRPEDGDVVAALMDKWT